MASALRIAGCLGHHVLALHCICAVACLILARHCFIFSYCLPNMVNLLFSCILLKVVAGALSRNLGLLHDAVGVV